MAHTSLLWCCLVSTCFVFIHAIRVKLPEEDIEKGFKYFKCPGKKEFKWEKADPDATGKSFTLDYKCGDDGPPKQEVISCKKGYTSNYKKAIIPSQHASLKQKRDELNNPEPSFGLISVSQDPNVMDKVMVLYTCLKENSR